MERTHPTFYPLIEQWEQHAQAIQTLGVGEAFVRLPNDTVHRVTTPTLPRITLAPERLDAVRQHYLHAYFRPMPRVQRHPGESPASASVPSPVPVSGSPPHRRFAGATRTSPLDKPDRDTRASRRVISNVGLSWRY